MHTSVVAVALPDQRRYESMLSRQSPRFPLADDPSAGNSMRADERLSLRQCVVVCKKGGKPVAKIRGGMK